MRPSQRHAARHPGDLPTHGSDAQHSNGRAYYHTTHTRSPREAAPPHNATAASPRPHIPTLDLPHAQAHPPKGSTHRRHAHGPNLTFKNRTEQNRWLQTPVGGSCVRTAGPTSAHRAIPAPCAAPPPRNYPQGHTTAHIRASRIFEGPRWPAHPPPTRGEHPHTAPPAAGCLV